MKSHPEKKTNHRTLSPKAARKRAAISPSLCCARLCLNPTPRAQGDIRGFELVRGPTAPGGDSPATHGALITARGEPAGGVAKLLPCPSGGACHLRRDVPSDLGPGREDTEVPAQGNLDRVRPCRAGQGVGVEQSGPGGPGAATAAVAHATTATPTVTVRARGEVRPATHLHAAAGGERPQREGRGAGSDEQGRRGQGGLHKDRDAQEPCHGQKAQGWPALQP